MESVIHEAGGGRNLTAAGAEFAFKAESDDTDGAFSAVELSVPAGWSGPPPHVHRAHEEYFYVLAGEFEFKLGEKTQRAGAGSFLFVPRDVPHAFKNSGDGAAKMLCMFTPAGYERYFDDLAKVMTPGQPPDPAAIYEVMKRHNTEPAQV
jgi:quercetin dioxygenase-like cupin family protein